MTGDENALYALWLKNPETGFLDEELGQYMIGADADLIEGLCAERAADGIAVCLRMGVGQMWADIGDGLYDDIYDGYDADLLPDFVSDVSEVDGSFNPSWEARFLYGGGQTETEDMIRRVLAGHRMALSRLHG